MHEVKIINLDLSLFGVSNEVALDVAETELAAGVADEDELELDPLVRRGTLELGVRASALRACDGSAGPGAITDDEMEETGGVLSEDGSGEDAELELDGDTDDPPVILVIVNAGLVSPESPNTGRNVS